MVLMNNFEIQLLNLILDLFCFGATIFNTIYVFKNEKDDKYKGVSQKETAIMMNILIFLVTSFTIYRLIIGV